MKLRERQLGLSGHNPPSRASWLLAASLFLVAFVVWTQHVRTGIAGGSRETAWVQQEFGTWPQRMPPITGTWDAVLSIHVAFEDGAGSPTAILGRTDPGSGTDGNNSNYLNGSRFVTGERGGRVTSASVHVSAPIAPPPADEFEVAIYTDQNGAPGSLLARTSRGQLGAPGWQTAPIEANLAPLTPYWLFYNTNGATPEVKNLTYIPAPAHPVDRLIRGLQSPGLRSAVDQFTAWGNLTTTTVGMLLLVLAIAWRRPARALLLLAAFTAGLTVVGALKLELAAPFTGYPSGHVFRAALVVIGFTQLLRHPAALILGGCVVLAMSFSVILAGGHSFDEVLGALLLAALFSSIALSAPAMPQAVEGGAPAPIQPAPL